MTVGLDLLVVHREWVAGRWWLFTGMWLVKKKKKTQCFYFIYIIFILRI